MAKEKNKPTEKKSVEVTESNIVDALNKGITANDTLSAEVEAEIDKENNDNIKREIKLRLLKARHSVQQGYLEVRRNRQLDAESLRKLANVDRLSRGLISFIVTEEILEHAAHSEDVVGGIKEQIDKEAKTLTITIGEGKPTTYKLGDKVPVSINYVDYDKCREQIARDSRERISKIEVDHKELNDKLDASFGEYYNHRWRVW